MESWGTGPGRGCKLPFPMPAVSGRAVGRPRIADGSPERDAAQKIHCTIALRSGALSQATTKIASTHSDLAAARLILLLHHLFSEPSPTPSTPYSFFVCSPFPFFFFSQSPIPFLHFCIEIWSVPHGSACNHRSYPRPRNTHTQKHAPAKTKFGS